MAVQSIADIRHIRHLWGDAPALIVIGAVLAALMRRGVFVSLIRVDPMLDDLRGNPRFEALAEKIVPARLFQKNVHQK